MNIIDRLATNWTKFIRSNYKDAASEKVLFYALSLLINTFLAYAITLFLCTITGHQIQGLVVICFYTLLRVLSGGVHLSTSLRCCVYTIVIFTVSAHAAFDFAYLHSGVILSIVSAIVLLITAPQGIKNISKIDEKYYPLLKVLSVLLVLSNLYFASSAIAIVFFLQAFHTTKLGYSFISIIDRMLNYTLGKGGVIYEK